MVSNSFAIKRARALPTRRALTKRSREPESLPRTGLTAVLAVVKNVAVLFLLARLAFAEPPGFSFPGTGRITASTARRGKSLGQKAFSDQRAGLSGLSA